MMADVLRDQLLDLSRRQHLDNFTVRNTPSQSETVERAVNEPSRPDPRTHNQHRTQSLPIQKESSTHIVCDLDILDCRFLELQKLSRLHQMLELQSALRHVVRLAPLLNPGDVVLNLHRCKRPTTRQKKSPSRHRTKSYLASKSKSCVASKDR
jgi:hypothetical protein